MRSDRGGVVMTSAQAARSSRETLAETGHDELSLTMDGLQFLRLNLSLPYTAAIVGWL